VAAALWALWEYVKPLVLPLAAYAKGVTDAQTHQQREAAISREHYTNTRLAEIRNNMRRKAQLSADAAAGVDHPELRKFDEK